MPLDKMILIWYHLNIGVLWKEKNLIHNFQKGGNGEGYHKIYAAARSPL